MLYTRKLVAVEVWSELVVPAGIVPAGIGRWNLYFKQSIIAERRLLMILYRRCVLVDSQRAGQQEHLNIITVLTELSLFVYGMVELVG